MTDIDKKILELKKEGYTNKQISSLLGLKINYVKRRGEKKFLETQKRLDAKKKADEEFEKMVIMFLPYSNSMNHLCTNLGVRGVKGYYDKINKIIEQNHLNTEHFGTLKKKPTSKGRNKYTAMTDEEFFVDNTTRTSASILKRLIKNGHREYKCENPECGITDWHNKEIKLQIHHINGKHNDNRLENLQILCPNCHSQTDNFARHNNVKSFKVSERTNEILENKPKSYTHNDVNDIKEMWIKKDKTFCLECGKEIPSGQLFCSHKCAQEHRKKFDVDNQTLIDDFKELRSYKKVGEKYGVTDNAIKKRCIKKGIIDEIQKYITSRKRLQ